MVLVNKQNPLPDGWEDRLETVTVTNSVGDEVQVEKKAYDAFLKLKEDLEENDGIYLELDSAYRSVASQQEIMDRYIKKYGEEYATNTVATPGYSEHHTGLALDLYFKLKTDDGSFTDVYYNEDLVKYPEIWKKYMQNCSITALSFDISRVKNTLPVTRMSHGISDTSTPPK